MAHGIVVSSWRREVVLLSVSLLICPFLLAQMPVSTSTTSTPVPGAGHDYLGDLAETVNPVNGSLSIRVKTIMPPGRGFTLPFSFAYDSNGVNYLSSNLAGNLQWQEPPLTITSQGGWSNTVPVVSVNELQWMENPGDTHTYNCWDFINYVYQGADGNRHNLNLTTYNGATNGERDPSKVCTWDTDAAPGGFGTLVVINGGEASPGAVMASIPPTDGSSPGPVSVVDTDGTSLYFPDVDDDTGGTMATLVEDRNGNVLAIHPPVHPATNYSYTDTSGRTVLQDTGFAKSPETVSISGLGGSYGLTWGSLSSPTFQPQITVVSGTCDFDNNHNWGTTVAVSTLTLPDTKSFTFSYDSTYGVVDKIQYPTGGYVRYVWGINQNSEVSQASNPEASCTIEYGTPAITDRYVSFDGNPNHEVLHQHFAYTTSWKTDPWTGWQTKQTTVTTTYAAGTTNPSFATVYTYVPTAADTPPNTGGGPTKQDPVESSIAYSDTTGSLLETVTKTWDNPRILRSKTTTFPNGQASETTWNYNSRELETERDDYDYGTTGVGSLLKTTVTNYQQFNLNFYGSNQSIADRPCQVITKDGSGNRVAETDYFYDGGTSCSSAGGASTSAVVGTLTGHDETNYSASSTIPRGNLTQKTQWLNTGGSSPVTKYTYDETGQVLSTTDPNQNQTSFSYTDSFLSTNSGSFTTTAGSPPSGTVTNAYLTKVTHPAVNGVSHIDEYSYGYNDGELTQSTNENSQSTTYRYNDTLSRITETALPDGGTTTACYNDSVGVCYNEPVPSVTTSKLVTSGVYLTTTTQMDGLGREILAQLTSDPDGTTSTATAYDGQGRKYTVTTPYRSTGDPTYGITTYTYDALGRTRTINKADGSTVSTSYSVNQTTVTDEAGNQRMSQSDALGRLTAVREAPNNLSYNYLTSYQYDPLNNLTAVAQNGSSSSYARNRLFVYDSLGRLVTAQNPESGTITYTYDANGNLYTKTAAFPDCTSSCGAVTTTYQYDALNRLTNKSYTSSANMPVIQFGYDGATLTNCTTAPPNITDSYGVGLRTSMCDGSGATAWTHDKMGRIQSQVQKQATSSSTSVSESVSYLYNLDGSLQSVTYPSGRILNYTYSQGSGAISAGRVVSVTDTTGPLTTRRRQPTLRQAD